MSGSSVRTASREFLAILVCSLIVIGESRQESAAAEPALSQLELSLLHRRIDLSGVRGFDAKTSRWQPYRKGSESLLVVHLWAVECAPCIAEMPILRNIVSGWRDEAELRFLFISETLDEKKLLDYWRASASHVPSVSVYQNTDERIRSILETGKQPITLLVDQDLVIRQAFIGTLSDRTNELTASMTRLLAVARRKK